jgi:hypothetical protein
MLSILQANNESPPSNRKRLMGNFADETLRRREKINSLVGWL